MGIRAHARGAARPALIVAIVVAAAGIAVAAWSVSSSFGKRPVRTPGQAAGNALDGRGSTPFTPGEGPDEGSGDPGSPGGTRIDASNLDDLSPEMRTHVEAMMAAGNDDREYQFARVSGEGAAKAVEYAGADVFERVADSEEAREIGLIRTERALGAWQSFIHPAIAGDQPGFIGAFHALGAPGTSDETVRGLFDQLTPGLGACSVDLASVDITPGGAGLPGGEEMLEQLERQAASEGETGPMVMMSMMRTGGPGEEAGPAAMEMTIPILNVFDPGPPASSPRVSVSLPARLDGTAGDKPDLVFVTTLAWNEAANAWQPRVMTMRLLSDDAKSRMRSSMRDRRREGREDNG